MSITRKATIFVLAGLALVFAGLSVYIAIQLVGKQAPQDNSVADGDTCNFALYGVNDPTCQPVGICCFCNKCGGDPATCNTTCGVNTSSSTTTSASPTYVCKKITLSQDIIKPGSNIKFTVNIAESASSDQTVLFLLDDAGQQVAAVDKPTVAADETILGNFNYQFDFTTSPNMPLGTYAVRFSHSGSINDLVIDPAACTPVLTISDQAPTSTSTTTSTSTPSSTTQTTTITTPGGIGGGTPDTPVADPTALPETGLLDEPLIPILIGLLLLIAGVLWLRSGFILNLADIWSAIIMLIPGYKTLDESRFEFENKFDQEKLD